MKLQQLLDYRPQCFVHQLPMKFYHQGLRLGRCDNDLLLYIEEKKKNTLAIKYSDDGTRKQYNKVSLSFDDAFLVSARCDKCNTIPNIAKRPIGRLSLDSIVQQYHRYSFVLDFENGKSDYLFGSEEISYNDQEIFYHLSSDLNNMSGTLKIGRYTDESIEEMGKGITILDLPDFDMARITSLQCAIDKCKLYNLFS